MGRKEEEEEEEAVGRKEEEGIEAVGRKEGVVGGEGKVSEGRAERVREADEDKWRVTTEHGKGGM